MKMLNTGKKCLACGAELPAPLFEITGMPFGAQYMPSEEELALDRGIDLGLCRCPACGLVQFDCEPVPYYRDAIRVVGLSETMKELRRRDYRLLTGKYGMAGKKWIECGCSNGDFLQVLREFDAEIYGTEWGTDGLSECRDKLCTKGTEKDAGAPRISPDHIVRFFPDREDMTIPGGPFDVFLSFNFLEHQPDPRTMLGCLRNNLKDGGLGLITVPSFEYIIDEGRYYELIRDHIANYDMSSLEQLCVKCGFEVLEKERIGIGDTLRIVVRKAGVPPDAGAACGSSSGGRQISAAVNTADLRVLGDDYLRVSRNAAEYVGRLRAEGKSAALWGAGHQGFTIASTTVLGQYAKYILDSSPKKQGRYAPASHLRIVPPEQYLRDPVDVIIISAPGYVREIRQSITERYADTAPGIPEISSVLEL